MIRQHRLFGAMIPILCVSLAACGGGGASSSNASSDSGAAASVAAESGTTSSGANSSSGYAIAGTIFGITGIDVTLSGSAATNAPTDSTGNFSFKTLTAGAYTVSPAQPGYVFTPVSRAVTLTSGSAGDLTFTATASAAPTYDVSGIVSGGAGAGVVVTLSGSNVGSTVTDPAGSYAFSGLVSGTYTVSAALPGYAFSTPVIVSVGNGDPGAANFSSQRASAATLAFNAVSGLPQATVGSPYSSTVVQSISGGAAPYSYALGGLGTGTPPLGMIVNPNGTLTGTPNTPGQYEFSVCATDAEGNVSACVPAAITVAAAAAPSAPAPTVSLTASSNTITAGAGVVLEWASENATSCAAGGGWSGNLTFSGGSTVAPTSTTTYSITCTNTQGSAHASVLVTVQGVGVAAGAPTVNLWATNPNIDAGATSTLQWSSTQASSCTASGGWSGGQTISGARVVGPTETTLYVLTCTGAGGTAQAQAVIAVTQPEPAPTISLSANHYAIDAGGSAALSWSATNASSCAAGGGWTGTEPITGSQSVSPTATTSYTLTCTGAGGGAQAQVVITVAQPEAPPTVSLTANPYGIAQGGSAVLSWSTTNAASCTASGGWSGVESITGTHTVSPTATTVYTLTCTGPGGSAQSAATITVGSSGIPPGTSWVYYDGIFDWPGDYSYVAVPDYHDTSGGPLSGSYDIKITLTAPYGGWLPYAQNWDFNSQGYTKLVFALKPTVANQQWTVYFVKVGDVPVGIYLNVLDYGPAPVVGQWNTYTVPLADLGVLGQSIYKFCIQDKTGLANNVWYADNVGFAP